MRPDIMEVLYAISLYIVPFHLTFYRLLLFFCSFSCLIFDHMRLLFFLILACFYAMVPFQSQAGVVSKEYSHLIAESTASNATVSKRSTASELFADLTHLSSIRSGNTQIRYVFLVKYFVATATYADAVTNSKSSYFIPAFLYCKPIGLLLVFPQHYFW